MEIRSAVFVMSNSEVSRCPDHKMPEYAFIGRSNVGKSSLINMLTNHQGLAKISGRPGKTRLINHFLINGQWYLVDLPGYGYAKLSKSERLKLHKIIDHYLLKRTQLISLFVLVDIRLEPQPIDLEFMQMLGLGNIPFSIVFTKADKLTPSAVKTNIDRYSHEMLHNWEELPPMFVTSAKNRSGREEILNYIGELNNQTGII